MRRNRCEIVNANDAKTSRLVSHNSHILRILRIGSQRGQVMLLTVLVLSACFLSFPFVAGLLTFYQLRQAGSVVNSVKAIYAAETGLELELYRWYKERDICHGLPLPSPPSGALQWNPDPTLYPVSPLCYPSPTLQNSAGYETTITYRLFNQGGSASVTTLQSIKSTGQAGNAARAFQVNL